MAMSSFSIRSKERCWLFCWKNSNRSGYIESERERGEKKHELDAQIMANVIDFVSLAQVGMFVKFIHIYIKTKSMCAEQNV